jgi:hypothetical protein
MADVPLQDVVKAYEANIAHHLALLRGRNIVTIELFASSSHVPDRAIQSAIRVGMERGVK